MSDPDCVLVELHADDLCWDLAQADPPLELDGNDLLVEALADCQSYRIMLQSALDQLHDMVRRYERLSNIHYRTLDELRVLRVHSRAA